MNNFFSILKRYTALVVICFAPFVGSAESIREMNDIADVVASYEMVSELIVPNIVTPTVVAVPLSEVFDDTRDFVVYDVTESRFVPDYIDTEKEFFERSLVSSISAIPNVRNAEFAIDDDPDTVIDFMVEGQVAESALITLETSEPVTTSAIRIDFAPNVSLPLSAGLRIGQSPGEVLQTVVTPRRMNNQLLQFPEATATVFEILLTYIQPLRIEDITILTIDDDVELELEQKELRFLAQPDHSYQIYAQTDRTLRLDVGESGDLVTDEGVVPLRPVSFQVNESYTLADIDKDGVPDLQDNCVQMANSDQIDLNNNGRGDVCDDFDRDGHLNAQDNCPNTPNARQLDEDGDGIGDACDEEESRFTEANPWVPWVGIGTAALVLLVLFALIAIKPKEQLLVEDTGTK